MKFKKKPIVVEAIQITEEWFSGDHPNPLHPVGVTMYPVDKTVDINTLEGVMIGRVGDWIITGVNGEKYPCKPDVFEKTYEPI